MLDVVSEPLMNKGAYLRKAAMIREFFNMLRHPKIGLLEPLYKWDGKTPAIWASSRDRMDRVMSGLNAMYSIVYHTRWMDDVADQTTRSPSGRRDELPDAQGGRGEGVHRSAQAHAYALHLLTLRKARRFDDWVMIPKITTTGYDSTAYERLCPIEDFLPLYLDKERDSQMWLFMTSSGRMLDYTTRILTRFRHREFPDLVRSRTTFAFNNGVYYAQDTCSGRTRP